MLIPGTNLHTTLFTAMIKREYQRMVPRTVVDLSPTPPRDSVVTQVDPTLELEMASEDYEDTGVSPFNRAAIAGLNSVLPCSDPNDRWASPEDAAQTLGADFGRMLRPIVVWRIPTATPPSSATSRR